MLTGFVCILVQNAIKPVVTVDNARFFWQKSCLKPKINTYQLFLWLMLEGGYISS